MLQQQHSAKL